MALIPEGDLCAVYGSLREGLGNHRVIQGCPRQADGVIPSGFKMYSYGAFPALTPSEEGYPITVEVYQVNDTHKAQSLDWLEGYPSFYNRKVIELEDGRKAWVYFVKDISPGSTEVNSGNWKEYLNL